MRKPRTWRTILRFNGWDVCVESAPQWMFKQMRGGTRVAVTITEASPSRRGVTRKAGKRRGK